MRPATSACELAGRLVVLDRLTRDDPIELFVLFSSVTAVIGTPGQANYVTANRTLETLAEIRHAAGLPALAGELVDRRCGYLVRETRVFYAATMLGSTHLRASQALDALPALLATGRPVVGLADVSWPIPWAPAWFGRTIWSEMPSRDPATPGGVPLCQTGPAYAGRSQPRGGATSGGRNRPDPATAGEHDQHHPAAQ